MTPSVLYECQLCFDIIHPRCVGINPLTIPFNEDLPNSWECFNCRVKKEKLDAKRRNTEIKQAKARARKLSVSSAASSVPTTDSERATTPSKRSRPDPTEVSRLYSAKTKLLSNQGCHKNFIILFNNL